MFIKAFRMCKKWHDPPQNVTPSEPSIFKLR